MKLKRIVEQQESASQYYDLGKDFFSFTHTIDAATEEVKTRFEQSIGSKIKGKKIRARASRGYKQFEKDYEIDAANVSLDDYYDNYVVVVKSSDGKEYFLKPGFKVQILGAMEPAKQPQQSQSSQPPQPPRQPQQPQQPQSQSPTSQPPMKEVKAKNSVRKFPIRSIIDDLNKWFVNIAPRMDLKSLIPREGVLKTVAGGYLNGGGEVVSYGIAIPVDQVPGLTTAQIEQALYDAFLKHTDPTDPDGFETRWNLSKFDARGDKYIVIIKRYTGY